MRIICEVDGTAEASGEDGNDGRGSMARQHPKPWKLADHQLQRQELQDQDYVPGTSTFIGQAAEQSDGDTGSARAGLQPARSAPEQAQLG